MKTPIRKIKSNIGALAKLACGMRVLRLHPKFRWLSYVCPIINRTAAPDLRLPTSRRVVLPSINPVIHKSINPPSGPPRLRLRKRRRVAVQPTANPER